MRISGIGNTSPALQLASGEQSKQFAIAAAAALPQNAAPATVTGTPADWIKDIGKNERQVLPSGTILLTGKPAEDKAMEIAKTAWEPGLAQYEFFNEQDKESLDFRKSRSAQLPRWKTYTLEEFLKHDPQKPALYDDNNRIGKEKVIVLGMYGDIILLAHESEAKTEQLKQQLLSETVRCMEKIACFDYDDGKNVYPTIFSALEKKRKYPLAIFATQKNINGGLADSAEDPATGKFGKNFDEIPFSTHYALKTKSGDVTPAWLGLFHELTHVDEFNDARAKYLAEFKGSSNPNPKGNWIIAAGVETQQHEYEKQYKDSNYASPAEALATKREETLARKAGVPYRKNYRDAGEFTQVDDPLEFHFASQK